MNDPTQLNFINVLHVADDASLHHLINQNYFVTDDLQYHETMVWCFSITYIVPSYGWQYESPTNKHATLPALL